MTTTTLTLTDFLLARIADDEAHLDAPPLNDFPPSGVCWKRVGEERVCILPSGHDGDRARVLAECEAKRAIVEAEVSPYPRGHAPATRGPPHPRRHLRLAPRLPRRVAAVERTNAARPHEGGRAAGTGGAGAGD